MEKVAEDQFEQYYTEKLWGMIPEVYRHEDGLGEHPGVLRAIVGVIATQAAILRRSQDRLWEDQFIEWCDAWAIPYIADLLNTRLISPLNERGNRVIVAKDIYYRRRSGTLAVLEELTLDVCAWHGKVVENYQRLARCWHGLDAIPTSREGRFTRTKPGGLADLRNPRVKDLISGPFDEFAYSPDVRKPQGLEGRYNIPNLEFNLYRSLTYEVIEVTPFSYGDQQRFTFDPSGRDVPLFNFSLRNKDRTPEKPYDWNEWSVDFEWELPLPLTCRLLAHAEYTITPEAINALVADPGMSVQASTGLKSLLNWHVKSEAQLRKMLSALPAQVELLSPGLFLAIKSNCLVEECGKFVLLNEALRIKLPDTEPFQTGIPSAYCLAMNLSNWDTLPVFNDHFVGIDPQQGRLAFGEPLPPNDAVSVNYHYAAPGRIGAGTYQRPNVEIGEPSHRKHGGAALVEADFPPAGEGTLQIEDNKTYGPIHSLLPVKALTLQAANQKRPYLRLEEDLVFEVKEGQADAQLVLDGLWLGARANLTCNIILRGNFECVKFNHCTIDPGGAQNILGETLRPVSIIIEGFVEHLCINKSILGPILLRGKEELEKCTIQDSILQSVSTSTTNVLELKNGTTEILRSTLLGKVELHRLWASNSIFDDQLRVEDTQAGCFRFSAAPQNARIPRPYESFLYPASNRSWFLSKTFAQPTYAQLAEIAPFQILTGAENGAEMGAFHHLINPIKMRDLQAKIQEFMPFGLEPLFINRT